MINTLRLPRRSAYFKLPESRRSYGPSKERRTLTSTHTTRRHMNPESWRSCPGICEMGPKPSANGRSSRNSSALRIFPDPDSRRVIDAESAIVAKELPQLLHEKL